MKQTLYIGLSSLSLSLWSEAKEPWEIDTAEQWLAYQNSGDVVHKEGFVSALKNEGLYSSKFKKLATKQKLKSMVVEQSAIWQNWKKIPNIGPKNAKDAPVTLSLGDGNYWLLAKYGRGNLDQKIVQRLKIEEKVYMGKLAQAEADKLLAELKKTPDSKKKGGNFATKDTNQVNGRGGRQLGLGGYHAWHSTDLKKWTHHGPVSNYKSRWMTTAEYVDGKFYLYYDNPNDQDPHLIIDENLKDGKMGKDFGMVFADPSNGSDNAVIRGLDGNFTLFMKIGLLLTQLDRLGIHH